MSCCPEQIEHFYSNQRKSRRYLKTSHHRQERRRAKRDPECTVRYRRYRGWEY